MRLTCCGDDSDDTSTGAKVRSVLFLLSNGDQYDGDWVAGVRHGHGLLRCVAGTIYDVGYAGVAVQIFM